jgi:predicted dehydrogenase
MKRKDFLKITGMGVAGAGLLSGTRNDAERLITRKNRKQAFNMSGYAAPALDTVRIGVIGIGNRGYGGLRRLSRIEGAEIRALCDIQPDRVERGQAFLENTSHQPEGYSGDEEAWKRMCERDDIDLVYICTPWHLHTPQAVFAMEHGKHAATELPAAVTLEECWQLVETSENTRRHCMMLGNVCYDFFEMITLNMARQGFFGEIIHGEGAYIHDLMGHNFSKTVYHNMWRLKQNQGRDGNLYAQHGIGPIAKLMNLNCGDKMEYLVSMSSNDFMMRKRADELAAEDDFWEPFAGKEYRGNISTSLIRTNKGRTIMLQHDVSSPRPYTRIHLISGTKGIARKWPSPARIATDHSGWLSDEEFKSLEEKYTPEITRRVGEMAREVGGHGGMDTMMDWRLIDCLRNGVPLDMDVYDASLWSSIGPLSEWSIANEFNSIKVPDFTSGAWETNKPGMDINLERGGTTEII